MTYTQLWSILQTHTTVIYTTYTQLWSILHTHIYWQIDMSYRTDEVFVLWGKSFFLFVKLLQKS